LGQKGFERKTGEGLRPWGDSVKRYQKEREPRMKKATSANPLRLRNSHRVRGKKGFYKNSKEIHFWQVKGRRGSHLAEDKANEGNKKRIN